MWTHNFRDLANMFVIYGMESAAPEDVAELLEARTRPVGAGGLAAQFPHLDVALGRAGGLLLI
jgi:hypothetical protein